MGELTSLERDYSLAQDFLKGTSGRNKNGVALRVFLSGEDEEAGRKALRRVLEYSAKTTGANILEDIADLFDPTKRSERKVVFKRLNQGHNDPVRDEDISNLVFFELYNYEPSKNEGPEDPFVRNKTKVWQAYETIGKKVGLTPERVKRICTDVHKRNHA